MGVLHTYLLKVVGATSSEGFDRFVFFLAAHQWRSQDFILVVYIYDVMLSLRKMSLCRYSIHSFVH